MCVQRGVSPVFVASDYLTALVRLSCKARTFFIRLHGGVFSSTDAVCSSWRRYSVKPSHTECAPLETARVLPRSMGKLEAVNVCPHYTIPES